MADPGSRRVACAGALPSFCVVNGKRLSWGGTLLFEPEDSVSAEICHPAGNATGRIVVAHPTTVRLHVGDIRGCRLSGKEISPTVRDGMLTLRLPQAGSYDIDCTP